jgi:hypothetical protein
VWCGGPLIEDDNIQYNCILSPEYALYVYIYCLLLVGRPFGLYTMPGYSPILVVGYFVEYIVVINPNQGVIFVVTIRMVEFYGCLFLLHFRGRCCRYVCEMTLSF